jgi:hypothetical protein
VWLKTKDPKGYATVFWDEPEDDDLDAVIAQTNKDIANNDFPAERYDSFDNWDDALKHLESMM